ncbi:hypothetical protein SO802_032913 [Lithocarpus litseifolius]|uniref:Uncharacterized protein n=1 Tax=Lithocarpus litseifolius TaxID=425828 RepID=A0AAW2BDC4_9ROSI
MALKAKSSDIDESSDNEDSKMKSYITRQSSSSQSKSQDKEKKDAKDGEDVDEEKDLVESKFEKMDEQDDIHTAYAKLYKVSKKHEKLHRLATKKLSDMEIEREELSTKFDEANQTIGALKFKNNFLAEKTKKLEAELFQNQFPSSFAPLGNLLKALMFLSNLNGFNSSPSPLVQGSHEGKVLPMRGQEK